MTPEAFKRRFAELYGSEPVVAWAPGRVNLIGEHIDYCGGSVMPAALEFGTLVGVAPTATGMLRAASLNGFPSIELPLTGTAPAPGEWGCYPFGACEIVRRSALDGVDVLVASDIPGSGLSSSAALCVALLYALGGGRIAGLELAFDAQAIEHRFAGVQCGIMDQAAAVLSVPGHALLLHCDDLSYQHVNLDGWSFVIADSMKPRELATSAYNERREQIRAAEQQLGAPLARCGADATALAALGDERLTRRARHVVQEQHRVERFLDALAAGDRPAAGALLGESHASLRDDFEVSCAELDSLVAIAEADPGVYGARMTGGGFGGSVVLLTDGDPAVLERVAGRYADRWRVAPRLAPVRPAGGVRLIGSS